MDTQEKYPMSEAEKRAWAAIERVAEVSMQIKELKEIQATTSQQIKESQAETSQQIKDLKESQKRMQIELGGMGNNQGDFAEEYFQNSFDMGKKTFFGETFDKIEKNLPGGEPNSEYADEYDMALLNCNSVAIIEIKFKAREFHVDDTVDKVRTFRANFPDYANHRIYLALAAMSFGNGVEDKCKKEGVAIIKQWGETVEIYDEHMKVF